MTDEAQHKGWYRRHELPHYDAAGVYQSITYRLGDALPNHVLRRFQLSVSAGDADSRTSALRQKVERYCDAGHGSCILRCPAVADAVCTIWMEQAGIAYDLHAWVVMPNHVHVLIRQYEGGVLADIVRYWKSRSTVEVNRIMGRAGSLWQPDYWDRFIRDADHYWRTRHYIHHNPVTARLAEEAAAWPWSSAAPA